MTYKSDAEREKWIRAEWFPNHRATVTNDGVTQRLLWQKLGTRINLVSYYAHLNALFVIGDLGEAIYQWGEVITLKWVAGLNLDYFAGKCVASGTGLGYVEWDGDLARKTVQEAIATDDDVGDWSQFCAHGGSEACWNQMGWCDWLTDHGEDWFGNWVEWTTVGERPSLRCHAHLVGLKMAFERKDGE